MRISDWSSDVCSSDLPRERSLVGSLFFSILPSLMDKSIDALEAGLRRADQEKSISHEASVNVEVSRGVAPNCIQFVKGRFFTTPTGDFENPLDIAEKERIEAVATSLTQNEIGRA